MNHDDWSLIASLWFFLPAGIANATPVFAAKVPRLKEWKTPLDLGKTYRGKRILGANKTWRGLVSGVCVAGLVYYLLLLITGNNPTYGAFLFGALMGLGALTGDAVESFFKRQRGVPAGQRWFPFDQIDYIIGGLLFIYPFVRLSLPTIAVIFVAYFGLHLVVVYVGYLLGIRDKPI